MIMNELCVLPPDLRPTSKVMSKESLNKGYSRVITRNHRLSKLLDLRAPQIIIHNEIRILQESVALLFDQRLADPQFEAGSLVMSLHRSLEALLSQSRLDDVMDQLNYALAGQRYELHCSLPHHLFRFIRYLRAMGVRFISPSSSSSFTHSIPSLEA